jgi:hypothetical protein
MAHRKQRRDVLVGDAVAIAVPVDEALDRAQAVDHPRGVEGVPGQRAQRRALVGLEHLGDQPPAHLGVVALVDHLDQPAPHLRAHVLEVAEAPPAQEAPLEVPQISFDESLVIGLSRADHLWLEAVSGWQTPATAAGR